MSPNVVRAEYAVLEETARRFVAQADSVNTLLRQLLAQVDELRAGGWIGSGANTFYDEMDGLVLPAVSRLYEALEGSAEGVQQVAQILRDAEDDAARLFAGGEDAPPMSSLLGIAIGAGIVAVGGYLLYSLFAEHTALPNALGYLRDTKEGKELEQKARQAGLKFVLPNGDYFGDENGTVVNIGFEDLQGARGVYRPGSGIAVVRGMDRETLGSVMAHEMQHAIDDQNGLFGTWSIDPPEATGDYISKAIDTEVRAHETQRSVYPLAVSGDVIRDDGVITAEERRWIMETRGYEQHYETVVNEGLEENYRTGKSDTWYEVDYWVDDEGTLQVGVVALETRASEN